MTKTFREYLLGDKCVVFTDNNPLSHRQNWVLQSNNGLPNLTVFRGVSIPPVDHAPRLFGHGGIPLAKCLASMTCYPGVWGLKPNRAPLCLATDKDAPIPVLGINTRV